MCGWVGVRGCRFVGRCVLARRREPTPDVSEAPLTLFFTYVHWSGCICAFVYVASPSLALVRNYDHIV
jgi:hypothetical protein